MGCEEVEEREEGGKGVGVGEKEEDVEERLEEKMCLFCVNFLFIYLCFLFCSRP